MAELLFIINVATALLLGVLIGLERQWRQHPAGIRTNGLVSVGAALFVSLSLLVDHEASPTRVAAQVVSGLGFLGGGVILREGMNVRGMTTAATIWCSGAVGTLAGSGYPMHAVIGTVAIVFVNLGLRPVARRIEKSTSKSVDVELHYRLLVICGHDQEANLRAIVLRHVNDNPNMLIQSLSSQDTDDGKSVAVAAEIFSYEQNDRFLEEVVARLGIEPSVSTVRWERE
jgi:putative Mg2+ transporter-C (MgtC) family protein